MAWMDEIHRNMVATNREASGTGFILFSRIRASDENIPSHVSSHLDAIWEEEMRELSGFSCHLGRRLLTYTDLHGYRRGLEDVGIALLIGCSNVGHWLSRLSRSFTRL